MKNIDKMRPRELHERILQLRERDGVSFHLKENDGFVETACPACGDDGEFVYKKYGFQHKSCPLCGTLYCSPRPGHEALMRYYSEYEAPAAWNDILVQTNDARKYLQHVPRVEKLAAIMHRAGTGADAFVEIGAGNGNFSRAVSDHGLFETVHAQDVSETCVASCRDQGLDTSLGTVHDLQDEAFDCVAFNDLIEHVFDPFEFVTTCAAKLRPRGILLFSTPNSQGFDFHLMGKGTVNITPPEHIQYFNPRSAEILVERASLKVLEITTPGILDIAIVRRACEDGEIDLANSNPYLSFLIEESGDDVRAAFQTFLAANRLSSHMLLFAYKP